MAFRKRNVDLVVISSSNSIFILSPSLRLISKSAGVFIMKKTTFQTLLTIYLREKELSPVKILFNRVVYLMNHVIYWHGNKYTEGRECIQNS